jgi:hypothetical protein
VFSSSRGDGDVTAAQSSASVTDGGGWGAGVTAGVLSAQGMVGEQQQQQQQQALPYVEAPLRACEAAWQPPQQLMARRPQPMPLLPHLTKPWVRQQTLAFQQQQQQQQVPQDQQGAGVGLAASSNGPQAPADGAAPSRPAAKVLPPLSVLLERALELEEELLQQSRRSD